MNERKVQYKISDMKDTKHRRKIVRNVEECNIEGLLFETKHIKISELKTEFQNLKKNVTSNRFRFLNKSEFFSSSPNFNVNILFSL